MMITSLFFISLFYYSFLSCALIGDSVINQGKFTYNELLYLQETIPSFKLFYTTLNSSETANDFFIILNASSQNLDHPLMIKFQTIAIKKYQEIVNRPENSGRTLFDLMENKDIRAVILYCFVKQNAASQSRVSLLFSSPIYNQKEWMDLSIKYFEEIIVKECKKQVLSKGELSCILDLIERLNLNSPVFNSHVPSQVHEWRRQFLFSE